MRTALLLSLLLAPLSAQPDRFGLPACAGPTQEPAIKRAFIVCHGADTKTPLWTVYELSASRLAKPSSGRRARFRPDHSLSTPGATVEDYRNSGYSRGHLVPARDVGYDEQAFDESFLLSNAVPQNSEMNVSAWRRLENWVRKLAADADSVIVVTGAIFAEDAQRVGAGVAVPSGLYKVILVNEGSQSLLIAVIMPNAECRGCSLASFMVTVAEVELRTGLSFFPLKKPFCINDFTKRHDAFGESGFRSHTMPSKEFDFCNLLKPIHLSVP